MQEDKPLSPKNLVPDMEIKAQIAYESLCDNYGQRLIDDILSFIKEDRSDLWDDNLVKKILGALNGEF